MITLRRLSILSTFAFAAVVPALQAGTVAVNLSEAQDFNLLVWNSATMLNSDIEGRAAVGGNASFSSYSIGNSVPLGNPLDAAFIVGGNLTAGNGQVYNGSIYVGGTYAGPGYNLNSAAGSVATGNIGKASLPFDFAAAEATFKAKSLLYSAAPSTGTSSLLWSTLTFTGTDSDLNIFSIDAATLSNASTLILDVTVGSRVLINVSGTTVNFSNKGLFGFDAENTLFNFYQATSLSMSGIGIEGSILAPLADVNFVSGQMNGQLIAQSFAGAQWGVGELHYHSFNSQDVPPSTVPDSANTAALLALGLLSFPLVKRLAANRR